jgi:hypothetical protein
MVDAPSYKYFTVDLVSNEVLAEIPFSGVSFERALKGAGKFSGTIAITEETDNLDLYESTMPGRTALYVLRNGVCIWGGLIWARDYKVTKRELSVDASELTSYLEHRLIWKTFNYSLEAKAEKTVAGGNTKITFTNRTYTMPTLDGSGAKVKAYISFGEQGYAQYGGFYEVLSGGGLDPTSTYFYVKIPKLPTRAGSFYSKVTVTAKVDTYQYVRDIIDELFTDFIDTEFANELIAPGVRDANTITYRKVENSIATITTLNDHGLIAGQRVEIVNLSAPATDLNGTFEILDVPSSNTFTFDLTGIISTLAVNSTALTSTYYPVKSRRVTETNKRAVTKVRRASNLATITTKYPHGFSVGNLVLMKIEDKYKEFNAGGTAVTITAVPTDKTFSYSNTGSALGGASGVTVKNSYAEFSVSRKVLEISVYDGYNLNFLEEDYVYVEGVDDPSWGAPMYDGYKYVTAMDPNSPKTWFQFDPEFDMTVEPSSIAQLKTRKYDKASNLITIITTAPHGFMVGDTIVLNMAKADTFYDGTRVLKTVTNATTFSYQPTSAGAKDVKEQAAAGTAKRVKTQLAPIANTSYTIDRKQRVGSTATIRTTAAHGFVVGDTVIVNSDDSSFNNSDSPVLVLSVPSITTFTYTSVGTAVPSLTVATGTAFAVYTNFGVVRYPTHYSSAGVNRTIYFDGDEHGFVANQFITVFIKGLANYNNAGIPVQITSVTADTITYTFTGATSITVGKTAAPSGSTVLKAASVSKIPTAFSRTYGEFPNNAGIGGITYNNNNYSQKQIINAPLIGSALTNVGDLLKKYSNSVDGFDYRIDCSVENVAGINVFKRQFILIPRTPTTLTTYLLANPLAPGAYAPVSAFGADKLVFEYPGNINDVTLQENAENGVTRMFVVGDGKGSGGGDAGARYAAASANELLADGWPLLESSEKVTWPLVGYNQINLDNWGNFDVEGDLQRSAERFLAESRPPMGEYSIEVNGTVDPAVGTYNPGDWCQIIIRDEFIQKRLNSSLEPRSNTILRKIESIKVAVTEGTESNEKVTLNLVPEWDIDKRG